MSGRATRAAALAAAVSGAILLALCLSSCRTVPIPGPTLIDVPPGLTLQAVEVAVLAGINNVKVPGWYDPTKEVPQVEYDALIEHNFLSMAGGHSWMPGTRTGDVRYATVDTRGHHLKVAIHLALDRLRIEFVESGNLLEENGQIHRKVPEWIGNLAAHIRRELTRLSARARGLPMPPEEPDK